MSESIFQSSHHALMFAFNFSHQAYEPPLMNRLAWGPLTGMSKGLSGNDGAAQAAMILSRLSKLTIAQQNVLIAKFAPRTWPCSCRAPCCSGHKRNDMWERAICDLGQIAAAEALSGCVSNNRLRVGIVKRIFGDKSLTLEQLAERTGVHLNTAKNHSGAIKRWLLGARSRKAAADYGLIEITLARADDVLIEAGIIKSEVDA
jgi:hypothetical protein